MRPLPCPPVRLAAFRSRRAHSAVPLLLHAAQEFSRRLEAFLAVGIDPQWWRDADAIKKLDAYFQACVPPQQTRTQCVLVDARPGFFFLQVPGGV